MMDRVADRRGRPETVLRVAAWTTIVSGVVAAIGLVFLIAMFAAFAIEATGPALAFGRINDTAVLVSYLLCTPSVLAVRQLLRPGAPTLATLTMVLGIGSIASIVVLQALLIGEVLTFEEQVGLVSVALLGLGIWFVVTGHLGARAGVLPGGRRMGILAATYVGYPIWAIWLHGRLAPMSAPRSPMAPAPPPGSQR